MKILVVCQHFYPEQFRINDICFEFAKRGHSVTVLTGLPNYPKGKVFKEYKWFKNRTQNINGVKVIRSFLIGRGNGIIKMGINYACFMMMASLKALLMKKDFDIIYVYQLSPITMAVPAILVKKMKNIPLMIHCLDQWPISVTTGPISKDSSFYRYLYKISRNIYNKADLITISSKSFKKYFEKVLKISSKEKGLIYWPSYAEDNYNNIESVKNDKFDVVFAGNIGPAQSVETIVEAANILRNNEDIFFHIVGDGLSKNSCENLANKYGLKNIEFYGFHPVSEMPKLYSLADAFIITMVDNEVVNQTLPAKIQSYMLAGKPIIGAISGEVEDVVKEANCGLCCKSLDFTELAKIIEKSSKDKTKINLWGKNAKKYYEDHFDKDICIQDLEKIMVKLIDECSKYKKLK
jgi:glycosyltransferase involved in cell wall biosynthesis